MDAILELETQLLKPEKKKLANGNTFLKGASLKKRLVHNFVSPRKKNEVQISEGLYSGKPRKKTDIIVLIM